MNPILEDVINERNRQDKIWGEQNHNPFVWMAILMEEIGEANKALLNFDYVAYLQELIQVAAVAIAATESYKREDKKCQN